jgi:hypothetical protein
MTTSDSITKSELIEQFENIKDKNGFELRVFPEGSNDDQVLFEDGGCTFAHKGKTYGSCDGVLFKKNIIVGIEMTDALNRGSSGSAQVQRFHHALGPVKNGYYGIYYLRKGRHSIRNDLYGMAYNISNSVSGKYLITDDLNIIDEFIKNSKDENKLKKFISDYMKHMKNKFDLYFKTKFSSSWINYFDERSTLEKKEYICRYQANGYRQFTEGTYRGGHLALGEMYLGRYLFDKISNNKKKLYMFFPRLEKNELQNLKNRTNTNKELNLLLNEDNVYIKTIDDLKNLPKEIKIMMKSLKLENLNINPNRRNYKNTMIKIFELLKEDKISFI